MDCAEDGSLGCDAGRCAAEESGPHGLVVRHACEEEPPLEDVEMQPASKPHDGCKPIVLSQPELTCHESNCAIKSH